MKVLVKLALAALLCFGLLQLVRPGIPSSPATAEVQASPQVRQILSKDCYSCHSGERRLSWFDHVVPAYWLVRHDILTAREHLNFSTLGAKPAAMQRASLYEAVNMVQLGAMPLPAFVRMHPDAKVTPEELATLKQYLAPWSTMPPAESSGVIATAHPANLANVPAEFNGLSFESGFESWKLISVTDRGDNNTFRFILGNDVAIKAARSGDISPWPDGARFAKVAWQQQTGADGLIHPGPFVQVEFMVKSAAAYKQTGGWGWGRWRGLDLKPYGSDAHFQNECVSCHLPLRGADYVYTLPLSTANASKEEVLNRAAATLPRNLPWQPLEWNAITMYVDRGSHTMSVLLGNDQAMQSARQPGSAQALTYAPGAVLALVTWEQRDDPHWFGARIPSTPLAIEFVHVTSSNSYRRFEGAALAEKAVSADVSTQRSNFMLHLVPAVLP